MFESRATCATKDYSMLRELKSISKLKKSYVLMINTDIKTKRKREVK